MSGARYDTSKKKVFCRSEVQGGLACHKPLAYAAERRVEQRCVRFNCRNRSVHRLDDPQARVLAVRRLPGICAWLSLGFLAGRASASGGLISADLISAGLISARESCPAGPAMVFAGASGKGVSSASAAGGAPGATNQRASASGLTADFCGTSSSMATGTSGVAIAALATTTGCEASTCVAGAVVSAVAVGPNESAVNERVTPSANNNANASTMTDCFIAASPGQFNKKRPHSPQVWDRRRLAASKANRAGSRRTDGASGSSLGRASCG